jgi:hypothetical protein
VVDLRELVGKEIKINFGNDEFRDKATVIDIDEHWIVINTVKYGKEYISLDTVRTIKVYVY